MPKATGPQATRPVYLKLRDEIVAAILTGRFAEGDLLPSVRAFAAEHGANPLTVAKAYQQFQDDGHIAVRRGIGVELLPGARAALLSAERAQFLTDDWPAIRQRMALLDLDPAELMANVEAADAGRSAEIATQN
ncbi:GntR family transcriptional regulator [Croceicoccus mobilis]|uniref:GntR family transcriptional regulator n=1 Tax=Croceicoccus mobilis TaxID=1703339 RepID=A0A916YUP2_9SPHN|nr:GntR family transcriptional regulator [Croceicoccus mobilis]GGD61268.1 GntR family transcriptional regulator [Croceicoccus mobilis]